MQEELMTRISRLLAIVAGAMTVMLAVSVQAGQPMNNTATEDMMNKTFHRFQPGTNCRAWLATILHHVRSNRRRARIRAPFVDDPDDRIGQTVAFVPPVPEELTDEEILAALARLPPQFQEVIVLCDVQELSYKEIAAVLSIPVGTVMSRLHRGRALLRSELGGQALGRPVRRAAKIEA